MSLDAGLGSNLIVPVVLWGRHAPTHRIASVHLTPDRRTLVTGCADGHIITWNVHSTSFQLNPYMLLVGHTARVTCMSDGLINTKHKYLVSSTVNGEMCTWDLQEGQCIETTKMSFVHRHMQSYQSSRCGDVMLYCCGEYADIAVVHPLTLELTCWLSSRVSSNWMAAMHVLRPSSNSDDVVMGVTVDGVVKIWTLSGCDESPAAVSGSPAAVSGSPAAGSVTGGGTEGVHYEHESKRLRCEHVRSVRCCQFNPRTLLIVCDHEWQIYDTSDMSLLSCWPPLAPSVVDDEQLGSGAAQRWLGGEFLSAERVLVWCDSGRGYIYQLPVTCVADHERFRGVSMTGGGGEMPDQPVLLSVIDSHSEQSLHEPPCTLLVRLHDHHDQQHHPAQHHHNSHITAASTATTDSGSRGDTADVGPVGGGALVVRADCLGQVFLWRLHAHLPASPATSPHDSVLEPLVSCCLKQAWTSMRELPVGILDQLEPDGGGGARLTASLYVPLNEGHLVCGREDGSIVIVAVTHTLMLHVLHGKHQQYDNWPVHQILCGHRGAVTTLLYPHAHTSAFSAAAASTSSSSSSSSTAAPASRYHRSHLVSGGRDFSVCVWDMLAGQLVHRFVAQAGVITQLHVPPDSVAPRIQHCVCSVAADHSVVLMSLKERRCVMTAARHVFPVCSVKWRPLDDFLVVETEDGSVSVWQMETGHLDRVVFGPAAQDVLSACDEHVAMTSCGGGGGAGGEANMATPAVHLLRGLRHRNMAAIRHAAKRGLQHLQNAGGAGVGGGADCGVGGDGVGHANSPLSLHPLRAHPTDPDSHVLFFDVEALIVDMLSRAYSAMSPSQLEELALVQLSAFQRAAELTRSQSPDAQQKITEFFGRMKHKAGDVEKKIKQKDSHGYLSKMKELKEQGDALRVQIKEKAETSEDLKRLRSRASQAKNKLEERLQKELEENSDAGALLARVKGGAGTVGSLIQTRGSIVSTSDSSHMNGGVCDGGGGGRELDYRGVHVAEVCRMLLSLVHSWGVDTDVDRLAENRLGLLRPKLPVSFGLISKNGYMSLLLPTFLGGSGSSVQQMALGERTRQFTCRTHWQLSCALTTTHLLALVSLANTLMSTAGNSFLSDAERHKKLNKHLARSFSTVGQGGGGGVNEPTEVNSQCDLQSVEANFWAQVTEGWSRLAALHCVHFPERMEAAGIALRKPLVEILAIKWQDRCVEIRQAAQALLLAELRRLSPRALKAVVDAWASLLPTFGDHRQQHQQQQQQQQQQSHTQYQQHSTASPAAAAGSPLTASAVAGHDMTADGVAEEYLEDQMEEEAARKAAANAAEARRKQATAVILLAVIGAEFGQDVSSTATTSSSTSTTMSAATVDGFGLGPLALHTSNALAHLLLAPPSVKLPAHTPLRRAAIDLIGRGFTQWEPHMDASRVLLALLELCCDAHPLAPTMSYGLPLCAAADTARTARHAVSLIAKARPRVFVTTMAREVARYNSMQQSGQSLSVSTAGTSPSSHSPSSSTGGGGISPSSASNMSGQYHTVLVRARAEILRVLYMLIEQMSTELANFLVELCDILLHCVDGSHLRQRSLAEVFPPAGRFNQISHCTGSRRLAVGAASGLLTIYDLRHNGKTQLSAHSRSVDACSFSPDGKFLASYSSGEDKISFWQTSTGMFGLGQSQTRCVKSFSTRPVNKLVQLNPPRQPRLVWISNRTVAALLADATEHRFNV